MQYKTSAEKEADNGEKIFKDFNNFTNIANSTGKCKFIERF